MNHDELKKITGLQLSGDNKKRFIEYWDREEKAISNLTEENKKHDNTSGAGTISKYLGRHKFGTFLTIFFALAIISGIFSGKYADVFSLDNSTKISYTQENPWGLQYVFPSDWVRTISNDNSKISYKGTGVDMTVEIDMQQRNLIGFNDEIIAQMENGLFKQMNAYDIRYSSIKNKNDVISYKTDFVTNDGKQCVKRVKMLVNGGHIITFFLNKAKNSEHISEKTVDEIYNSIKIINDTVSK